MNSHTLGGLTGDHACFVLKRMGGGGGIHFVLQDEVSTQSPSFLDQEDRKLQLCQFRTNLFISIFSWHIFFADRNTAKQLTTL